MLPSGQLELRVNFSIKVVRCYISPISLYDVWLLDLPFDTSDDFIRE